MNNSCELFNLIPKEKLDYLFEHSNAGGELDHTFLGFEKVYKEVLDYVPKDKIIIDLGCAYATQSYYFKEYAKYIGIDISGNPDSVIHTENSEFYFMTIQKFINEIFPSLNIDLNNIFAICSYVPDKEAQKLAENTFPYCKIYYPGLISVLKIPNQGEIKMTICINKEFKDYEVNDLPIELKDEIESVLWKTLEKRRDPPVVFSDQMNRYLTGSVKGLEEILDIKYEDKAFMDKIAVCKEIGNYFGDYFEENNQFCISNHDEVFRYNSPDELLKDWLDTILENHIDNFHIDKYGQECDGWEEEVQFIFSKIEGEHKTGIYPSGDNWKSTAKFTKVGGKQIPDDYEFNLGTYSYLADAMYARKTFKSLVDRNLVTNFDDLKGYSEKMQEQAKLKEKKYEGNTYTISYKNSGIYQNIFVKAHSKELAKEYFSKQKPDAEICGIRLALLDDKKPGMPTMVVPKGYKIEKQPSLAETINNAADRKSDSNQNKVTVDRDR